MNVVVRGAVFSISRLDVELSQMSPRYPPFSSHNLVSKVVRAEKGELSLSVSVSLSSLACSGA